MQNGIVFFNHPNSAFIIIRQSDRVLVSYEKCQSEITANCNKSLADTIIEIAWQQSKPVKIIEEIEYPTKPSSPTEWCGMVHIMEERHFTYEGRKETEYFAFAEYHYYYEIPELIDDNVTDYILLTIFGTNTRIKIKAIDFNWMESFLEKEYPELYREKLYCDVNLHYKKEETRLLLFTFNGFHGSWKEDERPTFESLFDKLYESEYAPCQQTFSHSVPYLKINKKEEPKNIDPSRYVTMYMSYCRYKIWKANVEKYGYTDPNKTVDLGGPTTTGLYDDYTFEKDTPLYKRKYGQLRDLPF